MCYAGILCALRVTCSSKCFFVIFTKIFSFFSAIFYCVYTAICGKNTKNARGGRFTEPLAFRF